MALILLTFVAADLSRRSGVIMSFKAPGNTPPGREPDINLGLRLPHRTARRLLPANVSQTTGPACRGGEIKGPRPASGRQSRVRLWEDTGRAQVARAGKTSSSLLWADSADAEGPTSPGARPPSEGLGLRRGWGSIVQPSGAPGVGALRAPPPPTPPPRLGLWPSLHPQRRPVSMTTRPTLV